MFRPFFFRGPKNFCWGTLFHNNSIIHKNNMVRYILGKFHFMRHYHHSSSFFRDFTHDIQNFAYKLRIKSAGRFIKKDNLWILYHRTRYGYPLLLAA